MDQGLGFDIDRLGAYLQTRVPGFRGLRRVGKFAGGQSNPTYRLDADSGTYVLRAKPTGELLPSAHMIEREFRVMQALSGSAVPVPKMLHLADESGPLGRGFFVMSHLEGRIFRDPALPGQSRAQRGAIYDAMNAVLAALHSVDVGRAGLSDFGHAGNYFARQTARWSRQYRASAGRPSPDMERISDWLAANLPDDDGQVALVHGDYRLDNMVFAPDSATVIGVLDWELSTLGHPLADLAYQCMQWRLPHQGGMRGLDGLDRRALGLPSEETYVAAYCDRRGLTAVDHWPFYLVFAFFRLAAILEGVVGRATGGNASDPQTAGRYAEVIPVLVHMAVGVMGKT